MTRVLSIGLLTFAVLGLSLRLGAAPPDVAHLAPSTTVLYLETDSAKQLLPKLLEHPLTAHLQRSPEYQTWKASPERAELTQAVAFVQWQLGVPWRTAVEKLVAGGVSVVIDAETKAIAAIAQTDDPAFAKQAVQTFVDIARADANDHGRDDPFRDADYRGIQAFVTDGLCLGVVDRWIIAATSAELAKAIVDRSLDDTLESLADSERFAAAYEAKQQSAAAWAYADLQQVRDAGVAPQLFDGRAPDPGAELLFGGLLSTLRQTPHATAELSIDQDQLELHVATPHDSAWTPNQRDYYFGPEQQGAAPTPLDLPNTVLEVRAYRQVEGIFLNGPELFNEEINAGLAKANSDLTTLFGGRPFAEDILGALDGQLRLVVVREPANSDKFTNATIRMPGLAAVGRLKDPADSQRSLRVAFQMAIGFVNLTGAQQGMPPLEIETERTPDRTLISASYWPDAAAADSEPAMMGNHAVRMQLSPTLGFQGDAMVLASTKTLAHALCDRLAKSAFSTDGQGDDSAESVHSAVSINAAALAKLVAENRQHLVAQNMLEKGHRRVDAEQEIDGLGALLLFFKDADARLTVDVDRLELDVRLEPAAEVSP